LRELKSQWGMLQRKNAVVYGVGTGSQASHDKFAASLGLPFPLLVDQGGAVARQYRAWCFIVKRTVYGIDTEGRICFARRGYPKPAEVAEALG
jgi:peroxiredoxin